MSEDQDLSPIGKDVAKTKDDQATRLDEQLKSRLDDVALLVADLGQISELTKKANQFAEAAKAEMENNAIARKWIFRAAFLVILGLALVAAMLLLNNDFDALRQNSTAFTTAMVVTIGGIVVLFMSITKAVFSKFSDRNEGLPMPSQLKEVVETLQDYVSNK